MLLGLVLDDGGVAYHVLHDLGLVSTREPFKKLFNPGMIQG